MKFMAERVGWLSMSYDVHCIERSWNMKSMAERVGWSSSVVNHKVNEACERSRIAKWSKADSNSCMRSKAAGGAAGSTGTGAETGEVGGDDGGDEGRDEMLDSVVGEEATALKDSLRASGPQRRSTGVDVEGVMREGGEWDLVLGVEGGEEDCVGWRLRLAPLRFGR